MFTHLFNAMPPFHHRAPGPIGAAAQDSLRPTVTLIPDGVHVHPAVLRMSPTLRRCFVTDRVAVADDGSTPGTLFGRPSEGVYRDGPVARLADGTLAGSTITMLDAARIMIGELEGGMLSVQVVTSFHAANALRLRDRGRIDARRRADLILVDRRLNLKAVLIGGREID